MDFAGVIGKWLPSIGRKTGDSLCDRIIEQLSPAPGDRICESSFGGH